MVCEKYSKLSPHEKNIFAGELFHAVISDNEFFESAILLIIKAYQKGLFDNVKILPDNEQRDHSTL